MCNSHPCFIIPPHILEALARRGNNACKRTLTDIGRIHQKRDSALNNLLLRRYKETGGNRSVYDCVQTYEQRLRLVRREGGKETADKAVNAAYDISGYIRDYFGNTFGIDSIDDNGMPVISNVHYGINYNNAYWDGDEMTYGDGDGKDFKNFALAVDVVAHELTHGVTQFLANLEYYGQSGALNEHFSDVFATIIKQRYHGQHMAEADWLIGDAIVTADFPGKAIRSIRNPGTANEFDIQPGHMDQYFKGSSDNQGVHINSGIPNRAFYLIANAIGMEHAAIIWFNTLKSLWRTANFQDLLDTMLTITGRLQAGGTVGKGTRQAVLNGFSAVGLHNLVS